MTTLSPAAARVYNNINAAISPDILDNIARAVWHDWGKGAFSDDEATFLVGAIDRRRPITFHRSAHGGAGALRQIGRLGPRIGSKFTPRPCRRRSSNEERVQRRYRKRTLGGSSALPDTMRHYYTEGERAVLCIVAGQVKHVGVCDLSIDEIADRAGVRRTTVQNAMHEARLRGHVEITERPQRGAKNLPNLVKITSKEWHAWIKRAPSAARRDRVQISKNVSITKNIDKKDGDTYDGLARAERPQGLSDGVPWARSGPPDPWRSRRHA